MNHSDQQYDSTSFISEVQRLFETDEEKILRLERDNAELLAELGAERSRRRDAEELNEQLKRQIIELQNAPVRKRRTKAEMESETHKEYCEFKSDGKRKSRPAEPIRSYDDFVAIQNYFLSKGSIRDYALWTVGVSLGLRISDLLSLKVSSVLDGNKQFRPRLVVIEQKTSKVNNCLITPSVVDALTKYFDSLSWKIEPDDYIFKSSKTKGKMYEEYGWRILSDAGKALNLPIVIGSHTMRKSFANIAACVDKQSIDMNSITKIQGLLNHASQQVTMRYLNVYREMFDRARMAVSDFVLGKTSVNILVAGNNLTIEDIVAKIDALDTKLSKT